MLENLTKRERLLILIGSGLIVFLLFVITIKKIVSWRYDYAKRASESRSDINRIDRLSSQFNYYRSLQSGSGDSNVNNIYTKLDPILIRYNLKNSVNSMKDSQTTVLQKYQKIKIDINFKSVPLNNVFRFIYDIEKNNQINARIESFQFRKPFVDKEIYDVTISLASYSKP